MNSTIDDVDTNRPEELNYYNYFTEIEQEFVRRRGAHMFISALDWALVETWKERRIPLNVALRGINQAFDSLDTRLPSYRRVNSIFYCQQSVEEAFALYKLAKVGEPAPADKEKGKSRWAKAQATFTKESLLEFIRQCRADLARAAPNIEERAGGALTETISRGLERLDQIIQELGSTARIDPEAIEQDLDSTDRMLIEALRTACADQLKGIRREALSQLREFKSKMDVAVYEQTVENYVGRRLRETYFLPRLSLFYM